jgi:uncharacterized 2Fe-2S/4Fe-4S cluster protein (DUF4445 family)
MLYVFAHEYNKKNRKGNEKRMDDQWVALDFPEEGRQVRALAGSSLLDVIRKSGLPIEADCGGNGKCGKCGVLLNGRKTLACRTPVEDGMQVVIPRRAGEMDILDDYSKLEPDSVIEEDAEAFGIAVDIGTTTVVVSALHLRSGRTLAARAFVNGQRPYGADVISRIKHSLENADLLSAVIKKQVDEAIEDICAAENLPRNKAARVVIAGNTTMLYLLLGLRCKSLGSVPFEPEFPLETSYPYQTVFGTATLDCPCLIPPFLSAYVGADITAGLLYCGDAGDFLLVDMGTNGEMAMRTGGLLCSTSTAAGPAFEGGGISCGMSGITGAIRSIRLEAGGGFACDVIGNAPPVGICGSGILDAVACLCEAEYIDESGAMSETFRAAGVLLAQNAETGRQIYFTQKDVREFQLAKSAIRAGIEVLMRETGTDGKLFVPAAVYLAGGFGQALNVESAFRVGLLPEIFRGKVILAGNSALGGCVKLCRQPKLMDATRRFADGGREINLAAHPDFNDLFVDYMTLEPS